MLTIKYSGVFRSDYKRVIKQGKNKKKMQDVLIVLTNEEPIPLSWKDRKLVDTKEWKGVRELHIEPDWLLIYKIHKAEDELRLIRTGSHSELFK